MARRRRKANQRQRPHFNAPTSHIKVRLLVSDRSLVDTLARSRRVYEAAVIRDALQAYLNSPTIKAELAEAQQRADQPGAAVAPTSTTDSAPVEGAESESEVLGTTCD